MRSKLTTYADVKTAKGWQTVTALIDSGAEMNLASQLLVKEAGWDTPNEPPTTAKGVNGTKVPVYGKPQVEIRVTDKNGTKRTTTQIFWASDIEEYELILGYPWLEHANPKIDWQGGT